MAEVRIIGPVVPDRVAGGVIYEITLASGAVATSPSDFGAPSNEQMFVSPVLTEAGQLLTAGSRNSASSV